MLSDLSEYSGLPPNVVDIPVSEPDGESLGSTDSMRSVNTESNSKKEESSFISYSDSIHDSPVIQTFVRQNDEQKLKLFMSSTKTTKHINVRYYFVKSRIDAGEVIVQWYSGEKLVGDFFSKPLSGSKFLRFRRKIMNHKRLDYCKISRNEESKDNKNRQNKQDIALVSVGMKKTIKSG